eukprot:1179278-Prorocentrum_minimum.AAC.3
MKPHLGWGGHNFLLFSAPKLTGTMRQIVQAKQFRQGFSLTEGYSPFQEIIQSECKGLFLVTSRLFPTLRERLERYENF